MGAQPKLFDGIEQEDRDKEKQKFGRSFKYLAPEFAIENRYETTYKSPVWSEKFQAVLDGANELRRELGYEKISQGDAFQKLLALEKKYDFESKLNLTADGVGDSGHIDAINKEMRKLSFRPDFSGCYDGGDNEAARSQFYSKFRQDYAPITKALSLSPLPPVRLDFDEVVEEAAMAAMSSLASEKNTSGIFLGAAEGNKALSRAISQIVDKAVPELKKIHILIEKSSPKPT